LKRKITGNYIYNLIYHALNVFLPMVTIPYVTRIIKPAEMGLFSMAQSVYSVVVIIAQFGVLIYGTRAIAIVQDDKTLLVERFRHIFSTQVFTTLLFLIPGCIVPLLITGWSVTGWIFAVNGLVILNAMVELSWFYNGQEEFRVTITRNIFVKLAAISLIFILVKSEKDIVLYSLIYVVAGFLGNVSMFLSVKKYSGTLRIFSFKWIDRSIIREAVPFMIPLLLAMIFVEVNRYFVYSISGEAATGIYDQAIKVARMLIILTTALEAVVTPRMSKFVGSQDYESMRTYFVKIFTVLILQTFLVAAGIIIVGNDFVSFFFGPEYSDVAVVLQVLAIYPLVFMLDQSVLSLLLRPLGWTKMMLRSILISLAVNIAFNIMLVPAMGAVGGVLSLIIATFVNSAIQAAICRKFILWRPILKNTLITLFAAVVTTAVLLYIRSQVNLGAILNFLVFGISCAGLYVGVVLLAGKEIRSYVRQYASRLIRRIKAKP